ncbi:MAG: DUF896 domain-containing protein [Phascolarctobacterium sp.]|nr:DUF896 domain-containing protein [Phascolarctobacterium sp.]
MEMIELIKRINEIAKKKRTVGLTIDEEIEQKKLYREYLNNIRGQVKSQLDNITIVDAEQPKH